ncbi:hypothetical protein DYH09_04270 [bacterium CPR1]|nr:hypothetical protein [bacterium CPR1]
MDLEARRERVDAKLCRATDQKMLKGSSLSALELLRQARQEAVELGSPWPELTAYRLAHLLLREGKELNEAEALFREAASLEALGPLPCIYRIAVCHRLGLDVERALREAHEALRLRPWRTNYRGAGIQSPAHNLLELAVYFTGATYSLEGLGSSGWEDLFGQTESWALVGPDPRTATVRYPRELALVELQSRGGPEVVRFEVRPSGRDGRWCFGEGDWTSVPHKVTLLLALLLQGRCQDNRELEQRLEAASPEALRTLKTELRRQLSRLAGVDPGRVLTPGRGVPRVLAPTAYGALPARFLGTPPANPDLT